MRGSTEEQMVQEEKDLNDGDSPSQSHDDSFIIIPGMSRMNESNGIDHPYRNNYDTVFNDKSNDHHHMHERDANVRNKIENSLQSRNYNRAHISNVGIGDIQQLERNFSTQATYGDNETRRYID